MNGFNPAKFIREVRQEGAKVTWPSRKETTVSTVMVMVLVVITAVFFLIVDMIISGAVQSIFGIAS